jgi:hypothetical protein
MLPLAELKLECIPDLIFPDPVPYPDLDEMARKKI